ncbi:hypothetical protein J6590_061255, partial [Homalodisca vitripennis]
STNLVMFTRKKEKPALNQPLQSKQVGGGTLLCLSWQDLWTLGGGGPTNLNSHLITYRITLASTNSTFALEHCHELIICTSSSQHQLVSDMGVNQAIIRRHQNLTRPVFGLKLQTVNA